MCPAHSKIYQIINIFKMMFVYHYVMIPFDPQNSYKKDTKVLTIEYHGG